MTIEKKLTICLVITLLMMALISASSIGSASRLGRILDASVTVSSQRAELVASVRTNFEKMKADATATQVGYVIRYLEGGARQTHAVDGVSCTTCHGEEFSSDHKQRFEVSGGAGAEADRRAAPAGKRRQREEGARHTRWRGRGVDHVLQAVPSAARTQSLRWRPQHPHAEDVPQGGRDRQGDRRAR